MSYIGKSPTGSGVRTRYYFTATGGETSLSGTDDSGKTLKFTDGEYVDVYLNGVALVAGTDYGTGTTNTINGLEALAAGDIVEIVVYDIYSVAKINSEAIRTRHYFTATGGETSIGTSQIPNLSFPANAEIEVKLNGVSLVQGTDYNTTSANTVGGLTALVAGQVVEIVIYEKFQLADTVSKAAGGNFGGGINVDGDVSITGNITANTGIGVVQVTSSQVTATTAFTTSSLTYVTDTSAGMLPSLNITPTTSASKIMIMFRIGMQHDATGQIENTIYRNSTTDLSNGNTYGLSFSGGSSQGWFNNMITWVDYPTTVGEVRYTWYSRSEGGQLIYPMHPGTTWSAILMELP